MKLNLNFNNNTYIFIALFIIAITGLIISVVSYMKHDVKLEIEPGGIIDSNAITIDAYLNSPHGISYMTEYFFTNFANYFFIGGSTLPKFSFTLAPQVDNNNNLLKYTEATNTPLTNKDQIISLTGDIRFATWFVN